MKGKIGDIVFKYLFLTVFGSVFIYQLMVKDQFESSNDSVGGIVVGFSFDGNGNRMVDYRYELNGQTYHESSLLKANYAIVIGDSIIIKYSVSDPAYSKIDWDSVPLKKN